MWVRSRFCSFFGGPGTGICRSPCRQESMSFGLDDLRRHAVHPWEDAWRMAMSMTSASSVRTAIPSWGAGRPTTATSRLGWGRLTATAQRRATGWCAAMAHDG